MHLYWIIKGRFDENIKKMKKEFANKAEFLKELSKMPDKKNIVIIGDIKYISQEYAINRMNELYDEYWSIGKITFEEIKGEKGKKAIKVCTVEVSYVGPFDKDDVYISGMAKITDEPNADFIGRAFLDAISNLGITFGKTFSTPFEV